MFKSLLREILSIIRSRLFILGAFFMVLFLILFHRLFVLQVVEGEDYLETFTYRIQKETQTDAPRGTIYDRNGTVLAYDRLSYSVTIEDSTLLFDNDTRNAMIEELIGIVEGNGRKTINNMPFILEADGTLAFTGSEGRIRNFKKDIFGLNYTDTLSETREAMTAPELFDYMRSEDFFNISPDFSIEETLKIMAIRYELYMKRYQKYVSVTVVSDVDDKMVAAIKENGASLPGVTIEEEYIREYNDSIYFAHITGYTGTISDDQLTAFTEDGHEEYAASDIVGKAGVESVYEYELAGTKGSQTLYVNSLGSVLDTTQVVPAIPGDDVYLTIDANLTKTIYDMLEEKISGILLSKLVSVNMDGEENKDHLISYQQVFHAFINNNIIDIEHFYEADATELEKSVGARFDAYLDGVMSELSKQLGAASFAPQKSLPREYDKYYDYMYNWLKTNNILNGSLYTAQEEVYAAWEAGDIGFGDFLKHAISEGWIDTSLLEVSKAYADTSQVYEALTRALLEGIRDDQGFHKLVYYYVLSGTVTDREICLLLYDQGILEKDIYYNELLSGAQSAEGFIYSKIYNMEITPDMLALDICSGAVVVTDPTTGEVRALVSYPSYDANRVMETEYYASLINNESRPLFNRATQQTSAPGSTYKMLVAAMALEEGLVEEDTVIVDLVEFDKVAPSAFCWNRSGHGAVDMRKAIGDSCNYYFYTLGYNASVTEDKRFSDTQGLNLLKKWALDFGFGQTTGIEIGEAKPRISDESAVRSYIGQGTNNYTPTQVNRYTAALANRGTVYNLSLVDKITDHSGNVITDFTPEVFNDLTQTINPKTWDVIYDGMERVCQSYSYKDVFTSLNLTVAGKSGTAQESELKPDHAWFTGFAPADDPQVAVTVLISNGYGSTNVVDTFRDSIAAYFGSPLYDKASSPDTGEEEAQKQRHARFPINYTTGGSSDFDDGGD